MEKNTKQISMDRWRKENRWRRAYDGAKGRCKPNRPYGKRGIKMLMSLDNFKHLWFRDKAYNMSQPSIDRINGKGDYTLANCRFIEMDLNRNPKSIMGIKVFKSAREAARQVEGNVQGISAVANKIIQKNNGKRHFSYKGYYWVWLEQYPELAQAILSAQRRKRGGQ